MAKYNISILSILVCMVLILPFGYGQATCPALEDEVFYQVFDCDDEAKVCFPVELEDVLQGDFEVSINGLIFEENYGNCEVNSGFAYSYAALFGEGEAGPYRLDTWEINGVNYFGEFPDIPALVDSMNVWDPAGGWVHNIGDLQIVGGDLGNIYSNMVIEPLQLPGLMNTLGFNAGVEVQMSLDFPVGIHEVIVTNTAENCADTTIVTVACTPADYIEETIFQGLSATVCLDDSELLGNVVSITPCGEDAPDGIVDFYINEEDNCVTYNAMDLGTETACFVICDDLNLCDTTYITVNVIIPPEGEVVVATILVGQTETECLSAENLSGNDLVPYNECPTDSGENVDFEFESGSLCIEYTGLTVGIDTACIVITDELGNSDTVTFYIAVIDPILTIPIAVPDSDTTLQNETIMVDVAANDTIEFLSTLTIITEPNNGNVYVTMDNLVSYEPNEDFCGVDIIEYEVCNNSGCDTTTSQIIIICDDVKVYNGFSPNQDGINDNFRIGGIEAFPNCSVKVFNAWGNLVYENEKGAGYSNESGWDGTWNGKKLPDGNYFYMIDLKDGSGKNLSGYVLVHR